MEKTYNLLVCDDDVEIRNLLMQLLQKYNYNVFTARNGEEMFTIFNNETIDLIILDVMLPGDDGLTLCRKLRTESELPIIMLTAAGEDTDRIIGLEIGADDYIAKPFNPRELIARIKAVLRRSGDIDAQVMPNAARNQTDHRCLEFEGWRLEMATRQLISPDDVEITISTGEYILLSAFLERPQQVLSRDQLLDITQNRPAGPFDRSIDVQVSRLRQKIEADPKKPVLIKTVRGGGYLFTAKVKELEPARD